jgi:hypothetical protein
MPWWDWLAWAAGCAASFGVLEGLAAKGRGKTLSTTTREFFGIRSKDQRRRRLGIAAFLAVLYGFAAWFGPHIAG